MASMASQIEILEKETEMYYDTTYILDQGFLIGENGTILCIGSIEYVWNLAMFLNGFTESASLSEGYFQIDDRLESLFAMDLG